MGSIRIVGIGPGNPEHRTAAAEKAIADSDFVVGYGRYLDLIVDLTAEKEIFGSSMMEETARADRAIEAASAGRKVAVVAGGDACVYGIGGLVLERMTEAQAVAIPVEIVPGITAANAAAAVLGAPLMNDYLVLSLSDLLTDRELILRRLRAAAEADLAVAIYNPRSARRTELIGEARAILLSRRAGTVPAGIVRNALREDQSTVVTTLEGLEAELDRIDMFSLVLIGNSTTIRKGAFMVTPRGYAEKYPRKDQP